MKEMSLSFCSFDSTWMLTIRLAKGTTTTQPAFNFFIKMKMVFFVFVVVVAACSCFIVTQDGVSWLCVSLVQWVSRAWRVALVSRGLFIYCFFASSLSRVFLLFSMFLSWEIWGMNMPNLPEVPRLEDLLVIGCVFCPCITAIDAPLTMIVVAGWVLSWYSWRPHDAFVAFVGKATLWLQGWSPWLSLLR